MKKLRFLTLINILILLGGCASKPEVTVSTTDNTQKFDKPLNFNTSANEKVGVRGDQVVIQKREYLETQLAKLQNEVTDLQEAAFGRSMQEPGGLWGDWKTCESKLADPRLGGTGIPAFADKWEKVTDRDDEFNYVVDKHDTIMAVSEEQVDARVVRFKKYKSVLTEKYGFLKDKLEGCQNRYKVALINHGMNPNDTQTQGEWVDGADGYKVWHLRRPATSDPEELAKRKQ